MTVKQRLGGASALQTSLTIFAVVLVLALGIATVLHFRTPETQTIEPAEATGAPLEKGDRVFISAGYYRAPAWLSGGPGYAGTIERFIPGQNEQPAAVIRTDDQVEANGVTGDVIVMELRWVDATWHSGAVAHVELCDFEPDPIRWQDRRQGEWVESHASIRHLE